MKILGLVLELNPFHKGHEYFIKEAIKQDDYDLVVAVVSTSFCMRGDISVIDKFQKTKLLLQSGVDVILENPIAYTINSSDYFCYHSVKTLLDFGVTDICFGTEIENIQPLVLLNGLITSPTFNALWKENIDKGYSYSTASIQALKSLQIDEELIKEYALPNNTLALGYIKAVMALNNNIKIHNVVRIDNNYYDEETTNHGFVSALSLRNALTQEKDIQVFLPSFDYDFIHLKQANELFYELLRYEFLTSDLSIISNRALVSEGIENRMASFINNPSFTDFISNVTTKRYSASRIKRTCLEIVLKNDKKDYPDDYLRILGFNTLGKKYLSKLPKETKARLITTIKKHLENDILKLELKASRLYDLLTNKETIKSEFLTPLFIDKKTEEKE